VLEGVSATSDLSPRTYENLICQSGHGLGSRLHTSGLRRPATPLNPSTSL